MTSALDKTVKVWLPQVGNLYIGIVITSIGMQ